MRRHRRRVVLGSMATVVAALAYGCTAPPVACTDIGSPTGVSVVVDRDTTAADPPPALTLTICQDTCVDGTVALTPGSVSVGQTCTSDDPDGSCSASASPDGTLVGFVDVGSLTAGEVKISGELRNDVGVTRLDEVAVTADDTHPNGSGCPAGGPQATVHVTRSGLR